MDLNFLAQSIIAMLVITSPPDPAKLIVFNSVVAGQNLSPSGAALKVAIIVFCILGGAAIAGNCLDELQRFVVLPMHHRKPQAAKHCRDLGPEFEGLHRIRLRFLVATIDDDVGYIMRVTKPAHDLEVIPAVFKRDWANPVKQRDSRSRYQVDRVAGCGSISHTDESRPPDSRRY